MGRGYSLAELAERSAAVLHGDGALRIDGVATLNSAGPTDLSFLANPRYRSQLATTRAAAVVVPPDAVGDCACAALVSDNPYAAFARIADLFDNRPAVKPGIHESAVVDPEATLGADVHVGALAVIEAGVTVADGAVVGAGSHVGSRSRIGAGSRVGQRATVLHDVHVGERVIVHPGAVIGADGFGLAKEDGSWVKVPQIGGVRIGDDCEIGANTTIDRGALEDTVLESDVRLDNQIQIAHNVVVGAHTAMAGCSAVAGSTQIGRDCKIGGGVGILGHLIIADHVVVTAMSLVTHSIREPGEYSSGTPLEPNRQWRRNAVRLRQLDGLARRLRALERAK
jgi:UDP-3-O-[3-hydroxymyristoyl] glucosamine N-acyltransferase